LENAPFKSATFIVEPGKLSPLDSHQVREIWFIVSGEGMLFSGDKKRIVKKGDGVFYKPHTDHAIENIGQTNLEVISIWW